MTEDGTGPRGTTDAPEAPALYRRGTFPTGERSARSWSAHPGSARSWLRQVVIAAAVCAVMAIPALVVVGASGSAPGSAGGSAAGAAQSAPVPSGPAQPAGAVHVDVDGDGRADEVRIDDGRIDVLTADGPAAYAVGGPDDQVLVGDWDCDGTATPLLYRPAEGTVYRYDNWPAPDEPERPDVVPTEAGGIAETEVRRGCPRLVIRPD